jgi:hypothetical protein
MDGEHEDRSNRMKVSFALAVVEATSSVVAVPKLFEARSWNT